jgi:SPOR domain
VTVSAVPTGPAFDWEAAGRELGAKLDRLHAVAVLGSDETETAHVALGIARHQSTKRRVAIGDLLGDAEPIQALAPSDDHHGLADVFEYGVSLDKVARRVEGNDQLYVLPTGAFITDHAEILTNRRWSRLAAGFRKEEGLLIVVASVKAPDIESLVIQLDGAVLVGHMVPARLPVARVLGVIRGPQRPSRALKAIPEPAPRPQYVVRGVRSLWKLGATVGVTLAAVIAALGIWLAYRPLATTAWAPMWLRGRGVKADSAAVLFHGNDSAGVAADTGLQNAPGLGLLTKMDSASISPYGIALVTFNTQAGALLELQRNGATFRAGTFTPVLVKEAPWFRVVVGAYPDSASAAALLDTLRARGTSDAGRAVIERYPYALLVERDVPDSAVAARVSKFRTRGVPVYALLQSDGTARVYAGAFKKPEEAVSLFDALRTSGVFTSLVYRTGRVY